METIVYQAWAKGTQSAFSLKHFMIKELMDEAVYPGEVEKIIVEQLVREFKNANLEIELIFMYEEEGDE